MLYTVRAQVLPSPDRNPLSKIDREILVFEKNYSNINLSRELAAPLYMYLILLQLT